MSASKCNNAMSVNKKLRLFFLLHLCNRLLRCQRSQITIPKNVETRLYQFNSITACNAPAQF